MATLGLPAGTVARLLFVVLETFFPVGLVTQGDAQSGVDRAPKRLRG